MSYKTGDYNGSEIAIVGISCRFPGSSNPGQFWENLRDGVESITFLNPEELEPSCIDQANPNDPNYVSAASILCDIELFDAAFFGYLPREAEVMDPQHRLFLECAWEALEDSGTDPKSYGGPIGVFAGARTNTYLFNLFSNREKVGSLGSFEIGLGNDLAFLPARVSYKLDLTGPSYAIHTACSTSLVAVHLACQSLLIAECDMALAGGVAINIPHRTGYLYQPGGIVSADGHCRVFDVDAQGTIFGSGIGVVALKRLADALAERDNIYAIIKGSATNNDGASKASFTAPSVHHQTEVILEALANAGVGPETISYIEAHGTGTALGDPIEIHALTRAFAPSALSNPTSDTWMPPPVWPG
jgi:acyl transferase domain-containing protein